MMVLFGDRKHTHPVVKLHCLLLKVLSQNKWKKNQQVVGLTHVHVETSHQLECVYVCRVSCKNFVEKPVKIKMLHGLAVVCVV